MGFKTKEYIELIDELVIYAPSGLTILDYPNYTWINTDTNEVLNINGAGDATTAAGESAILDTAVGNISTNTTDIGTNTTDIGTNAGAIATNITDIGNNTTAIGTNTTDVGNLQTALGSATAAMDFSGTNYIAAVTVVDTAVSDLDTQIKANEDAIGDLDAIDATGYTDPIDGSSVATHLSAIDAALGANSDYVNSDVNANATSGYLLALPTDVNSAEFTILLYNEGGVTDGVYGSKILAVRDPNTGTIDSTEYAIVNSGDTLVASIGIFNNVGAMKLSVTGGLATTKVTAKALPLTWSAT